MGVRLGEDSKGGRNVHDSNSLVNRDDEFVECQADGSAVCWKGGEKTGGKHTY